MNKETLEKIMKLIDDIETIDDLEKVNNIINSRWDNIVAKQALKFNVGDNVSWENSKNGTTICGKVRKVNKKSVNVDEDVNGAKKRWRVCPSLLTKV